MGSHDPETLRSQLARERTELARTLRTVGPDAPTLAGDWKARDIAAHVAGTEQFRGAPTFIGRWLVARHGVRLNERFPRLTALEHQRSRRRGFEWSLRRIERPGPALLVRPSVAAVTLFELFVHHEDVRRPNGIARVDAEPDVLSAIEWLLGYQARRLGSTGLRIVLPGRREIRGGGRAETLTVRGEPSEVLLWLAGRREHTAVSLEGFPDAVDPPALGV